MPTQVVGPYIQNNKQVIQTDVNETLDSGDAVCIVTSTGVTITMPPNPLQTERSSVFYVQPTVAVE
jgi:hypothetical protein